MPGRNIKRRSKRFFEKAFARLFKHIQPLDIALAPEIEEQSAAGADELEPVITDLASGQRQPRSSRLITARPVLISVALLLLATVVGGAVLIPAWQNWQASSNLINLHVVFSDPHLGNFALPAWADDSITEEIYSGFGPPSYYGTACYARSVESGVCGNQHLTFVDDTGNLYTWNKNTGKLTREITNPTGSPASAILNWKWLYSGEYILAHTKAPSGGGAYKIWDVVRSRLLYTGNNPLLTLGSDGRWIATYAGHNKIQIVDGLFGEGVVSTLSSPHFANLIGLVWSPDTTELATASADGTIQIWNAFQGTQLQSWSDLQGTSLTGQLSNLALAWSPSGQELASASLAPGENLPVHIWNTSTGQLVLTYARHTSSPTSLSWLDGGQEILSSNSQEALLWNSSTGQTLAHMTEQQLAAQPGYYMSELLLNEPLLAVPSGSSMQILDMRTGHLQQTLVNEEGHYALIAASWNPDQSTYPVAVDKSGDLLVWQMHPWQIAAHYQLPCSFTNQSAAPIGLAWSPDGKELAIDCGNDGLVVLKISVNQS